MKSKIYLLVIITVVAVATLSFTFTKRAQHKAVSKSTVVESPVGGFAAEDKF